MASSTDTAGPHYLPAPGGINNLYIDGYHVDAVVEEDGHYTVFAGGYVLVEGELSGAEGPLLSFFARAAVTAADAQKNDPVAAVHAAAKKVDALALVAEAAKGKSLSTRSRVLREDDPRHPGRRAALLRREASILAAWTAADETAYTRYLQDSYATANGRCAPLDRAAWKS